MSAEPVDLGHGHSYRITVGSVGSFPELFPETTYMDGRGESVTVVGIIESHARPDGELCEGYVSFCRPLRPSEVEVRRPVWSVESLDPLTISPSVLCGCGAHGFIRQGRWVPA